jgi:hypothetical protein
MIALVEVLSPNRPPSALMRVWSAPRRVALRGYTRQTQDLAQPADGGFESEFSLGSAS